MPRSSTVFLQVILVLIGIAAAAFLLWEPQVEGRNASATQFEVYFKDPFLAFAYVASLSFFTGLYQAFKVLSYARQDRIYTQGAVDALRIIKYCALAMIGFVAVGEIYILSSQSDDAAGGVMMGVMITFGSVVIATAAAMFQQLLQSAVDMKSEHDLTV